MLSNVFRSYPTPASLLLSRVTLLFPTILKPSTQTHDGRWCRQWSQRVQSILKEINPKYSLAGLMLRLKLQYFGHLMWRTRSLEKTLMLGKIKGRKKRGQQRMRWLDGITDSMDMSNSLQPHGLQQTRLPCPSSLPKVMSTESASSVSEHTVLSPH